MLGLGWPELLLIGLVGFFVFGPERLPTLARDAARMIKQLRSMADDASAELRAQLPSASEFGLDEVRSLRDLHPKTLVTRALFDSDTAPDLLGDGRGVVADGRSLVTGAATGAAALASPSQGGRRGARAAAGRAGAATAAAATPKETYAASARVEGTPPPYDLDAT